MICSIYHRWIKEQLNFEYKSNLLGKQFLNNCSAAWRFGEGLTIFWKADLYLTLKDSYNNIDSVKKEYKISEFKEIHIT